MDKFLEVYDVPKLNQEDVKHLNWSITSNETETAIESPHKEKPRTCWIHCQILPAFKEELLPVFLKKCYFLI
jgi:hypothetical protein